MKIILLSFLPLLLQLRSVHSECGVCDQEIELYCDIDWVLRCTVYIDPFCGDTGYDSICVSHAITDCLCEFTTMISLSESIAVLPTELTEPMPPRYVIFAPVEVSYIVVEVDCPKSEPSCGSANLDFYIQKTVPANFSLGDYIIKATGSNNEKAMFTNCDDSYYHIFVDDHEVADYSGASLSVEGYGIRLVGGDDNSEGRVELFYEDEWGTMCGDSFDIDDGHVICRMLGFAGALNIHSNIPGDKLPFLPYGDGTIWLQHFQCDGNEAHIRDCVTSDWGDTAGCDHLDDIGVKCSSDFAAILGPPGGYQIGSSWECNYDVDVQFEPPSLEEVYLETCYATSCQDICDEYVECAGFTYVLAGAPDSGGTGIVGTGACYFKTDVSIIWPSNPDNMCYMKQVTTTAPTIQPTQPPSPPPEDCLAILSFLGDGDCDTLYNNEQCGYDGGDCCPGTCVNAKYICGESGYDCLDTCQICDCTVSFRDYLGDGLCDTAIYNNEQCGYDGGDCCPGTCVDGFYPCSESGYNCQDPSQIGGGGRTDIRLASGSTAYEGRVEVYHDNIWGPICDDGFDLLDAAVICRMLSIGPAVRVFGKSNNPFGAGVNGIWFTDLDCNGDETEIDLCAHGDWGIHGCGATEVAGVRCQHPEIQLVDGIDQYEGRVELYYLDLWGTVCDDGFDFYDASVICKMLGFGPVKEFGRVDDSYISYGSGQIWLDEVDCFGNETDIFACSHREWGVHNCFVHEDVFVICHPPIDPPIRLTHQHSQYGGKVEVFHDGEWGTICINQFGEFDAKIICRMLGFRTALEAITDTSYYGTQEQFWIDSMQCDGQEESISECQGPWGPHNCAEHQDAAVTCALTTDCPPANGFQIFEDISEVGGSCDGGITRVECLAACDINPNCVAVDSEFTECCTWTRSVTFDSFKPGICSYLKVPKTTEPTEIPPRELSPQQTLEPTIEPTLQPTPQLTDAPTPQITEVPTPQITEVPTPQITEVPTPQVTEAPTPQVTEVPTTQVTEAPTSEPSKSPTSLPITSPLTPTTSPSLIPTTSPSLIPTTSPSLIPTTSPSLTPTTQPTSPPSPEEQESEDTEEEEEEEEDGDIAVDFEGPGLDLCKVTYDNIYLEFNGNGTYKNCPTDVQPNADEDATESENENVCETQNNQELYINIYGDDVGAACFPVSDEYQDDVVSPVVDITLEGDEFDTYSFRIPVNPDDNDECSDISIEDTLDCKWYDPTISDWSTEGCETKGLVKLDKSEGSQAVLCECTHLTAFAVLQNVAVVEERCRLSNIVGNDLWIVSTIGYVCVLVAALIQTKRAVQAGTGKSQKKSFTFLVHILIVAIGSLNTTLSILLYLANPKSGDKQVPILVMSVMWAFSYILSFWVFAILVYTWAKICHASIPGAAPGSLKRVLIVVVAMLTILIILLFVAAGVRTSLPLILVVKAGSITIAGICVCMAVLFFAYGTILTRRIRTLSNSGGRTRSDLVALLKRLSKVTLIISASFVCQSVILLISGLSTNIFYEKFVVFQVLYFCFDLFLLFSVIYLFYHVIESQHAKRDRESTRSNAAGDTGVQGYSRHQDIEMADAARPSLQPPRTYL